jgi:hypothetical protein
MNKIVESLRSLWNIINKLHYGRMPTEVEAAMTTARAALAEHDAQPAAEPAPELSDQDLSKIILRWCPSIPINPIDIAVARAVIAADREKRAQPVAEPVAELYVDGDTWGYHKHNPSQDLPDGKHLLYIVAAPAAQPAAEPQQERTERDCDAAFDAWYAMQMHQLSNEQVCKLIWTRGWQAALAQRKP